MCNMCDKPLLFSLSLLLAVSCVVLLQTVQGGETITAHTQVTESSEPYLLVATISKILRMSMDGTNVTTLINESYKIVAIDYHYRLNLIFWVTGFFPDVKHASLTDGSDVTSLQIRNIDTPVGLAVDWINDKVYWSDQHLKAIYAYDLDTRATSKAETLDAESNPSKLKIYPQSNDEGWLFIGDLKRHGIYKISLNNEEEEKLITSTCPHSIALDYTNGNIFWIDNCNYQLGTSKIDGSLDHFVPTGSNSYFSYGASVYNTHVYWIEAGETSIVDCFEMETSTQNRIYAITGTITRDIQIVHSSNQPSLATLVLLERCQQSCVNGRCDENAQCICEEGWTGQECASVLSITQTTSAPQTTPTTIAQTTPTTAAQTTPTTAAQTTPTTAARTMPTTAAQTTPTTAARTTQLSTTAAPQTTPPIATDITTTTTSSSTSLPSTTPLAPSTTSAQTPSSTSSTDSDASTPDDQKTTSGQQATTSSAGSAGSSGSSDVGNVVPDSTTTSTNQGFSTEDGSLQVDGDNEIVLIMVAIFPAVGLVIVVIAIIYAIVLYYKCKNRKMGIYNVQERHQEHRPPGRLESTAEFGTESVRGSFRDITERYHQERILRREIEHGCSTSSQGCAEEVGCAAEMTRTPRGCAAEMDCVIEMPCAVEMTSCATEMDCAVEMPCAVEMTPSREMTPQACAGNMSSPSHSLSPSTASEASSSCGLISVHVT